MGGQVRRGAVLRRRLDRPGGDLLYATNVAAQMVGAAGMTDTLVSFAAVQGSALQRHQPGRPGARRRRGPAPGRGAAAASRRPSCAGCSTTNQHLVAALRDALLERHELIGREITDVLEQAAADGRRRTPIGERTIDLRTTPRPAPVSADE